MQRGRSKGLKTVYCAKKRQKTSNTLKVTAAPISMNLSKPVAKMEAVVEKAPRKVKEPVLVIKPAAYAQKRQNQLLELTQGNFYKKSYRKKAC